MVHRSTLSKKKDAKSFYKLCDKINEGLAQDIETVLGFSVAGYSNEITSQGISHIEQRHGKNGKQDHSMENLHDLARINYIVENYEKIWEGKGSKEYKNKDNTAAKTIVLQKKIAENYYYVVEAVPETSVRSLKVVSAHINANDTSPAVAVSRNPSRYVLNEPQSDVSFSINSIPQNQKNATSEKQFSDRATTTIYDYVGETAQLQQENNQLRKDVVE